MDFKMRRWKVIWGIVSLLFGFVLIGCNVKTRELKDTETVQTEAPLAVEDTLPPEETVLPEETELPLGLYVSADVYGTIIHNEEDAQIVGQNYKAIAEAMDFICPMVYPSHYNNGVLGVERPEAQAYEIIKAEMEESKKVLSDLEEEKQGAVRVWIQDFSATWIEGYTRYTKEKIREQIQAVYDSGYEEWILWNARNNYTEGALERP